MTAEQESESAATSDKQGFDRYEQLLERYQENPVTRDALYGKAVALMKLEHNVEAKKEFATFVGKYPTDDKVAQAKQYLKDLSGPAHPPLSNGKKRTK